MSNKLPQIHIRVEPEIHEWLRRISFETHVPIAAIVRELIYAEFAKAK